VLVVQHGVIVFFLVIHSKLLSILRLNFLNNYFFSINSNFYLQTNQPAYDIIGYDVCVGDHKVRNLFIFIVY
jgi:hypothetical protein